MPSETPNLDFIVSRPQAYFQSEKSRRSEIQAMARSELATLRERVKQARNAALDEAKDLCVKHRDNYVCRMEGADLDEFTACEKTASALNRIIKEIKTLKGS